MSERQDKGDGKKRQINEKLRKARLRQFLTIGQIADRLGISRTTYTRWEQGYQKPHLVSLAQLCQFFKASPSELGFGDVINDDSLEKGEIFNRDLVVQALNHMQRAEPAYYLERDHSRWLAKAIENAGETVEIAEITSFDHPNKICIVLLRVPRISSATRLSISEEYKQLSGYDIVFRSRKDLHPSRN